MPSLTDDNSKDLVYGSLIGPMDSKTASQIEQLLCLGNIATSHPSILWNVGHPDYSPVTSSSKRATAFSSAGNILSPNQDDRGSWKGAVRHVLWQSDIASQYTDEIAKLIGDCHEIAYKANPNNRIFTNLDDADSSVDQLNNVIGREIGNAHKNLSTKERAFKVLDKALTDGLYTLKTNPQGQYEIVKERMDYATYFKLYKEILLKDENGL